MGDPSDLVSRIVPFVLYRSLLATEDSLQRLFSTFPNAWPGAGLLLLRMVVGILLIHDGIYTLMDAPQPGQVLQLIAACAGILLLVGLWTPIMGAVLAFVEIWIAVSIAGHLRSAIIFAALGAALAALGPGAWSIDARLFGRKRLEI